MDPSFSPCLVLKKKLVCVDQPCLKEFNASAVPLKMSPKCRMWMRGNIRVKRGWNNEDRRAQTQGMTSVWRLWHTANQLEAGSRAGSCVAWMWTRQLIGSTAWSRISVKSGFHKTEEEKNKTEACLQARLWIHACVCKRTKYARAKPSRAAYREQNQRQHGNSRG